jgi:hypothetical protein
MGWVWKNILLRRFYLLIIGFWLGLVSTAFAQVGSDAAGLAYCGKGVPKTSGPWSGGIEFPYVMGPPENWPELDRVRVYNTFRVEVSLNMDTDEVPQELIDAMKRKGKYVFPCDILKDKASWKRHWLNDPAAKQRIKLLKQTHEKYMDCMYDHRKEINKLNKKVIEHRCKKKTRWEPLGYESVAGGEM